MPGRGPRRGPWANLHVLSGSGTTAGTVNGLGNVIIGYNEKRGSGDDRSGSHMLVVGKQHNFSSYGGIVVGHHNETSAPFACVSGGTEGIASGRYASVSGGYLNAASGKYASVSGGYERTIADATGTTNQYLWRAGSVTPSK